MQLPPISKIKQDTQNRTTCLKFYPACRSPVGCNKRIMNTQGVALGLCSFSLSG